MVCFRYVLVNTLHKGDDDDDDDDDNNNNNTKQALKWLATDTVAADPFPARELKLSSPLSPWSFPSLLLIRHLGGEVVRSVKLSIHLSFVLSVMSEASQPRFARLHHVLCYVMLCYNVDRSVICDSCSRNELKNCTEIRA
jgi:hypothetical protein